MVTKKTGLSSIATVCQAAGATRADFEQALAAGVIEQDDLVVTEGGYRKVLDAPSVTAALRAFVSNPTSAYDLMAEKAKREHFAACREELRFLEESGTLMRREAHEKLVVDFGALVKTRLEQLPAQHAARLCALGSARDVERELDELVRSVLAELAAEADRMTE